MNRKEFEVVHRHQHIEYQTMRIYFRNDFVFPLWSQTKYVRRRLLCLLNVYRVFRNSQVVFVALFHSHSHVSGAQYITTTEHKHLTGCWTSWWIRKRKKKNIIIKIICTGNWVIWWLFLVICACVRKRKVETNQHNGRYEWCILYKIMYSECCSCLQWTKKKKPMESAHYESTVEIQCITTFSPPNLV